MSTLNFKSSNGTTKSYTLVSSKTHTGVGEYLGIETNDGTKYLEMIRKGFPTYSAGPIYTKSTRETIVNCVLCESQTSGHHFLVHGNSEDTAVQYREINESTGVFGSISTLRSSYSDVLACIKTSANTIIVALIDNNNMYFYEKPSGGSFSLAAIKSISAISTTYWGGNRGFNSRTWSHTSQLVENASGVVYFVSPELYIERSSGGTWGTLNYSLVDTAISTPSSSSDYPVNFRTIYNPTNDVIESYWGIGTSLKRSIRSSSSWGTIYTTTLAQYIRAIFVWTDSVCSHIYTTTTDDRDSSPNVSSVKSYLTIRYHEATSFGPTKALPIIYGGSPVCYATTNRLIILDNGSSLGWGSIGLGNGYTCRLYTGYNTRVRYIDTSTQTSNTSYPTLFIQTSAGIYAR